MSLSKIKHIDIVFENCDSVGIYPQNDFDIHFYIRDIKTHMSSCNSNECSINKTCEYFRLSVSSELLKSLKETPLDEHSSISKWDAIKKWNNITHVRIYYDDKDLYVSTPWAGTMFYNWKQRVSESRECGSIELSNKFYFKQWFKFLWYHRYYVKYFFTDRKALRWL